jgi:hypothetical protein
VIGLKEVEVDESQKGMMSRVREKKIKSLLIEYLKASKNSITNMPN